MATLNGIPKEGRAWKIRCGLVTGGILLLVVVVTYLSMDAFSSRSMILDTETNTSNSLTDSTYTTPPKRKIAFLKIPKTASTTVACIFYRFGLKHNLSMFLPQQQTIRHWEQRYLVSQSRKFDIYAIDTTYNHRFFTRIVKNAAIIGLIRNPEERLISHTFYYWRRKEGLKDLSQQEFIDEIIHNSDKYHATNIIAEYFGIPIGFRQNVESLQNKLNKINSEFLLVLIRERLDESLVLMKRLLNWTFSDILHGHRKVNKFYNVTLNSTQKEYIQNINKLDFEIYEFFENELQRKIDNQGEEFIEEVRYFRQISQQHWQFCKDRGKNQRYIFPRSKWEPRFVMFKKDCKTIYGYGIGIFKEGRLTTW